MTDDAPAGDRAFKGSKLEELTDLVAENIRMGEAGPSTAVGIHPRDLELDADGLVVTVKLGDDVLLEHSFEPEEWENVDSEDPGLDLRDAARELTFHLFDEFDVKDLLVERRRKELAERVVEESETEIASKLEEAAPGIEWDLSAEIVELPYEYRHGDPEWVYEQGYPPFALEVVNWSPYAEVVIEIEYEPPNVERLVERAVGQLLEETKDG